MMKTANCLTEGANCILWIVDRIRANDLCVNVLHGPSSAGTPAFTLMTVSVLKIPNYRSPKKLDAETAKDTQSELETKPLRLEPTAITMQKK